MAGRLVAAELRLEQRLLDGADLLALPAARVETARRRRVGRAGHVAAEDLALAPRAGARDRDRREQRAGVGVARVRVQVLALRKLDDLAQVHHGHAVAHVPDDGQVVRDEDDREAELALEVAEEVEDLGLDRDVERRHRLVRDDQLRLERERARHADALALAARELVREAVVVLGVQPDLLHQLLHLRLQPAARLAVVEAVDAERLADDRADRLARVERRVRVLEDHLHLATERLELALREAGDVPAAVLDRPAGRVEQAGDQARRGGLAAAGLPHQAERLALHDVERHAVDSVHGADLALEQDPARDREVLDEVADLDQRLGHAGLSSSLTDWRSSSGCLPSRSSAQMRLRVDEASRHAAWWPGSSGTGSSIGSISL